MMMKATKNTFTIVNENATQAEILEMAKQNDSKYIICYNDHYRGNSKGEYFTPEQFAKLTKFAWSDEPNDRFVLSVHLTSADVPAMIEARLAAILEINKTTDQARREALEEELNQTPRISSTLRPGFIM